MKASGITLQTRIPTGETPVPAFCRDCTFGPNGVQSCAQLRKHLEEDGEKPYSTSPNEVPECFENSSTGPKRLCAVCAFGPNYENNCAYLEYGYDIPMAENGICTAFSEKTFHKDFVLYGKNTPHVQA